MRSDMSSNIGLRTSTRTSTRARRTALRLLGWTAIAGSAIYLDSDVVELARGGFSNGQLWATLVGEAVVPAVVVGLAAAQWPRIGRLGVAGAVAYGYSFVYFTGTVVYALVDGTSDFDQLSGDLGPWMTVHGAVMLAGGLAFGYRTARAGVLPAWSGAAFAAGVAAVALGLPGVAGVAAAGLRDLGVAAMGAAVLRRRGGVMARA